MDGLHVVLNPKEKILTITLPFENDPSPSKSGNTLLVATTRGAVETGVKVNGQAVRVNVNAYIYAHPKAEKEPKA